MPSNCVLHSTHYLSQGSLSGNWVRGSEDSHLGRGWGRGLCVHKCICKSVHATLFPLHACCCSVAFNKSGNGLLLCASITGWKIREFKDLASSLPIRKEKVYPTQMPHRNTSHSTGLLPVHTAIFTEQKSRQGSSFQALWRDGNLCPSHLLLCHWHGYIPQTPRLQLLPERPEGCLHLPQNHGLV